MSINNQELNSIRKEIIEKKKENSIERVLQSLEKCEDKKIKDLIKTIKNIYNLTNDSYTISNKLTTDINNLKTISTPNKDLQNNDINNINKLIEELKKDVKGNEDNSKIGLSNSYLMVLSSIIKYAKKIKCPPKLSKIDTVIQYFYNWSKKHAQKWKKGKKEGRKRDSFKINTIIFPIYVITKIIIHTHLYQHPTGNVSHSAEFNLRLNDYLIDKSSKIKFNKTIFIPFLNMYLDPLIKQDIEEKEIIQVKNISAILQKDINPFLDFIKNFETLFDILSKIDKKEFYSHLILTDDESLKSFKNSFYDSILKTRAPDRVGPHFTFGRNIPPPTFKGFRQFYKKIRDRFESTTIATPQIQKPSKQRQRTRINAWSDKKPKRPTRKAPPLRVKTPNLGKKRPTRQAPRLPNDGVTNFEENMAEEIRRKRQQQREEDKRKYRKYRTSPKNQASNNYPPTYDPSNRNPGYSKEEANRALGVNRGLPDLSSLGPGFKERNKIVNKRSQKRRFNNNKPPTGGNKTKKRKHKKKITHKNKKKKNKNKLTKHNKKKYKNHKTTRKNK